MNQSRLPLTGLLAYGGLALPLAMAALPVYVQAPRFYTADMGLSLTLAGAVLFGARLIDTAQDPWLGSLVDRAQHRARAWLYIMSVGALVLAIALALLLIPPSLGQVGLAFWLGATLIATYTAHSLVNITLNAWGARLSDDESERVRVTSVREGLALVGVLLASILPSLLAPWLGIRIALAVFAVIFALLLALACWALWRSACRPQIVTAPEQHPLGWRLPLRNTGFRRLALVFVLNGLAISIPATLALFFIGDRLQLAAWGGLFLAAYFLCGALALPLWSRIAQRMGKTAAWRLGMALGAVAFLWASQLGAGDFWPYLLVCVLTGLVLGADLALPPALLADLIPADERGYTASYFGLWSLLGKLPLALAGLCLPLLAWWDYQPGQAAGISLALVYAGIPCVLKLVALCLLPSAATRTY